MDAGDVIERLRNPDPPWQHRDVGNEADIAHELIALGPGIASEHFQFSLIRREAENRVERGRLAGAVRSDESEDAALFDPQIDAVQRDGCAEGLAQAAGFNDGHDFGSFFAASDPAAFDSAASDSAASDAASSNDDRRVAAASSSSSGVRPSR